MLRKLNCSILFKIGASFNTTAHQEVDSVECVTAYNCKENFSFKFRAISKNCSGSQVKVHTEFHTGKERTRSKMVVYKDITYLILGVVLVFPSHSCLAQSCPTNLVNKVVYEGTSASFDIPYSVYQTVVQWQVDPASNPNPAILQTITNNGVVEAPFTNTYAVNETHLTIFKSTVAAEGSMPYSTAGLYYLNYVYLNCQTAAGLIVIKNGPVCILDSTTLFCQVEFAESNSQNIYPIMTWKNSSGATIKTDNSTPSRFDAYNYPGQYRAVSRLSVGDNNVYFCQLTFSAEQNASSTPALARNAPDFTASCSISTSEIIINPSFGPEAGGTVLTIVTNWTSQVVSVSAVYIGYNLRAEYYNSSGNTVLVKTPTIGNQLLINQPLPIILEISPRSSNISTGKNFTYKPNPRIVDVRPRELFISGGTNLTVSGYSLDSVAYPLVRAVVIITNGSIITYYNESYESCYQPTENGTNMVCTSPPVYIRQDFLSYLYDQATPNTNVYSRRKRDLSFKSITTNQTYTLPASQEQMIINLGIVFDGFYSNGNFYLKYPPNISCASDIQYADIVAIQGNGFMKCCTKDDYTIRIGTGFCSVKILTDNALTCSPPKDKPQQTDADKLYCGDNFVLFVELKNKTWTCSCLKYQNGDATRLIIIIVATVGSFLLLFVVIAVILAVLRKKQKIKSLTHREVKDAPRTGHRDMTSNNSQPRNNVVEGTTENGGSVYYSREIPNPYLELEPDTYGQSDQEPKDRSECLSSTEYTYAVQSKFRMQSTC